MKALMNFFNRSTKPENIRPAPRAFLYKGGILVNPETALKVAALYRGVNYLSSQLAKLPINIKNSDDEIVTGDPIQFILNTAPNDEMNKYVFWASIIVDAIMQGAGYAEIERNMAGRAVALHYLEAGRVEPFRDQKARLRYRVGPGMLSSGVDTILTPREIFVIPNLFVRNGIGQGVVSYAKETLGISMGADRMAGSLFQNGGIPSGILKHPKTISDDAYERMKNSWKESHAEDKTGGVAILEEGVEFEALNMDPEMLQMLESRKFGILEICRFLNLPPYKLYDNTNSGYNNAEQANLDVVTDTLSSWAVLIESEIDVKLLSDNHSGRYSEMDMTEISRGDMKTRGGYYKDLMSTGSIAPNEIRKKEGLPGYSGGDEKYIATNNYTPASRVNEVIDAQVAKAKSPSNNNDPGADAGVKKALIEKLTRG